ncbi:MAG: UDP-N-acetylmuramate dehydrogenase [Ghiorsea sp.]
MSWHDAFALLGKMAADVPLASRTTLGIGGAAAWLFRPQSEQDLLKAVHILPENINILPLGRGSNLLIADEGLPGVVIDLSDLDHLEVAGNSITAGAGVRMGKLAQAAATHGLSGLEFMATVPGDLGGGVAMNAGAFGQQVSDVLVSIEVLLRDGSRQTLKRAELDMAYRYTSLPESALVMAANFSLKQGAVEGIRQDMREMRKKRSESQPLASPNCGSVFKNPDGDFAARLIEGAGLKGMKIGNARISDVHANFIVNEGGASCEDVLALIRLAKMEVMKQFNVDLQPEVRLVGCCL